ncbi:sensor histidine kinase [Yinghuangia sp. YIM S09857]|uniref:sensor histidine kinase n=1 Tax=Yinghuangia sp. YIM S09857 TaxID=3436929 RepID=UPI003F536B38
MGAGDRFGLLRAPEGRLRRFLLIALVASLAITAVQYAVQYSNQSPSWWQVVAEWLLILSACAALWFGQRFPVAACAYVLAATGIHFVFGAVDVALMMVLLMVALYAVAARGLLTAAVVIGALTVCLVGMGTLGGNDEITTAALFMLAGWVVAVIALGASSNTRRAYRQEAEARLATAQRGREEEALRRATEERLRIARELHDVIGHNISLINVQAGAALHRLKKDPAQAEEALGAIKTASRETLRELRTTLGVLRQVDEDAPTAPAAGLARLADLVAYAELAGLDVRSETDGEPRELPVEVDLAAFRIMQESLTNVTRHAAAASVVLRVVYGITGVRVEVDDDGAGAPRKRKDAGGEGTGNGIRGMRERARALGGELTAGPRPGGGFRVRAYLPYEAEENSG